MTATPIAIIGMAARLPGAADLESFWKLIRDGGIAISTAPPGREALEGAASPRPAGFIEGVEQFDREFFGISEDEAVTMDPQQRLLLEVAWDALEDAGQTPELLRESRTGVFVGIGPGDYGRLALSDPDRITAHTNTGNFLSIAANRLSYAFGLTGPSMAIDTACSASLVAVHLACQSLRLQEASLAIACGVNVLALPEVGLGLERSGTLSPTHRCRPFDSSADGYVRGEGAGVVVLKPLARALADGDRIRATILSTAVGHNGLSNGLTAPRRGSQEAVLRMAYELAGVPPSRVDFVETHGTATLMGDAIEAGALGAVLGRDRPADTPCWLGALKANIGHLETAAGVVALIKSVLALEKRELPPTLSATTPNPHVDFDKLKLRIPTEVMPWPAGADAPLAGVSAFGVGGTNAHIVLRAAPAQAVPRLEDGAVPAILTLSARSRTALHELAKRYIDVLEADESPPLRELCQTLNLRRTHHPHRVALVAAHAPSLTGLLRGFLNEAHDNDVRFGVALPRRPKVGMALVGSCVDGTGVQTLIAYEKGFRDAFLAFDQAWSKRDGARLLERLATDPRVGHAPEFVLATHLALLGLWRTWGVSPDALLVDALGELAAGVCTGAWEVGGAVEHLRRGTMPAVSSAGPNPRVIATRDGHLADAARSAGLAFVLGGAAASLSEDSEQPPRFLASVQPNELPSRTLRRSLAALHVVGYPVSFRALHPVLIANRSTPGYPWQRQSYWLAASSRT